MTIAQTIAQPQFTEVEAADHAWRQTNHIWSSDELEKVSIEKHEPVTMSDHLMKGVMNVLYHGFNFVTGYDPVDPSPAVRRMAAHHFGSPSLEFPVCGRGLPALLLVTYAEARPWRHLHFP